MRRLLPILLFSAVIASCSMQEEERAKLLETAGRTNFAIGRGDVVRDMRAPSDTGRLIYNSPVNLSRHTAPAAGARQVWAPFGIATPDTVPARATPSR